MHWEISREKIRLLQQLGIGEFGAVYDAEVRLEKNVKSRALVKVITMKASIVRASWLHCCTAGVSKGHSARPCSLLAGNARSDVSSHYNYMLIAAKSD